MAENKEKTEVTLEDLQKQIADLTKEVSDVKEENTKLKTDLEQKNLEINKLTLGGITKTGTKETKVEKEDEEVVFDFDF